MNHIPLVRTSRREFLRTTARIAAVTAAASSSLPFVHAAGSDLIQVALIGCGGRGTGAADNALSTVRQGPIKLVAMAEVFDEKLKRSVEGLSRKFPDQFDVPPDRRFTGWDGYKKAMDCLKPGDVAIFATPPAFRWVHLTYAIEKGLNVFMEKPVTVDGPTTRRMFELADAADKKNLKVGVGLMVRHCRGRQELWKRIREGEIGDIVLMRGYRTGGQAANTGPKPANMSEFRFQVQRFHSFLWSGGGLFSDYNIHQVDELSWMKDAWPVSAHGTGGRHFRGNSVDQNFDSYSVEYTYPDGTKMFFIGRHMNGCHEEFASYVHGTKGAAIVSTAAHTPGRVRTFKGHNLTRANMLWAFPQPEPSPYQLEWDDLIAAIRGNQPYNEIKRGAIASLVTSMGRMAAHTGQIIQYEDMLNSDHEYAPGLDQLGEDSPAPLQAGPDGKYPVPTPGQTKGREF
ncbi:MAG: Gfo/Idh/MocA family oxidoreductase [Verrucomicrobia bacterium]|nr:Gfo/Idh/MocA family oxidoreductase [Verrucomicrobiota bacterium]